MAIRDNYLSHIARLMPSQAAIVRDFADGVKSRSTTPLRVVASAGSGKTFTVVGAVAYLLNECLIEPADCYLTTFTNKAGAELAHRFAQIVPESKARATRLGTFHSLSMRFMAARDPKKPPHGWNAQANIDLPLHGPKGRHKEKRRRPDRAEDYTALDVESSYLWKRILSDWPLYGSRSGVKGLLRRDNPNRAEFVGVRPSDIALWAEKWRAKGFNRHDSPGLAEEMGDSPWLQAWELYDRMKDALGAWDFADVLWAYWQRGGDSAKLVIVDEAQDNQFVQLDIARQLAEGGGGRFVLVGDVRQAIYQFRGAVPATMANLDRTHGAMTLEIPENHRSGRLIVELGNAICYDNGNKLPWVVGSDAVSTRLSADGTPFIGEVKLLASGRRASDIAAEIKDRVDRNIQLYDDKSRTPTLRPLRWGDFAILCRTNAMMAPYEASLLIRKIPYRLVGSGGFFNTGPARQAMALLLLAFGEQIGADAEATTDALKAIWRVPGEDTFKYKTAKDVESAIPRVFRGVPFDAIEALSRSSEFLTNKFGRHEAGWEDDADALVQTLHGIRTAETFAAAVENTVSYLMEYVEEREEDETVDVVESGDRELLGTFRDLVADAAEAGVKSFAELHALAEKLQEQAREKRAEKRGLSPEEKATLEAEEGNKVTVSTVHRCVAPETLVEVEGRGIVPAAELVHGEVAGVGTPDGPKPYCNFVRYENRRMLKITTEDGFEVAVTDDHGLSAWTGETYERTEARRLQPKQYLRLALSAGVPDPEPPELPDADQIELDVRAVRYTLPRRLSGPCAFLFGALVADGTVYHAGVRYVKGHRSAAEAVACAFTEIGAPAEVRPRGPFAPNEWMVEINSVHVAQWLLLVGGMAPNAKTTPPCVMAAPREMQADYLRGLFSDGTVGVRIEKLDVVSLTTVYPAVAKDTQYLLRRLGIVGRRFWVPQHESWRVEMYSVHARKFLEDIGFPDVERTERGLAARVPEEKNYTVPVSHAEAGTALSSSTKQNARTRGYVSRRILARDLPQLVDRLRFHHDRIASIEPYAGPAVCVEVPDGNRFLQGGFDGWNSKGLEWGEVYVLCARGELPFTGGRGSPGESEGVVGGNGGDSEEERLFYVAVTRARDRLTLATGGQESPLVTERLRPVLTRYYPGETVADDEVEEGEGEPASQALTTIEAVEEGADVPMPAPAEGGAAIEPAPPLPPADPLETEFLSFCEYVATLPGASPLSGMSWAQISEAFQLHRGEIIALMANARARVQAAMPAVQPATEEELGALPDPVLDEPLAEEEAELELEAEAEVEAAPTPSEPTNGNGARERVAVEVKTPDPVSHYSGARLYLGPGAAKSWVGPIPRGKTIKLLTGSVVSVEEGEPGLTSVKLMRVEAGEGAGYLFTVGEGTTAEFRKDPKKWTRLLEQAGSKLAGLYTHDALGERPHLRGLYEWTGGTAHKVKEIPATLRSEVEMGLREGVLRERSGVVEWALGGS